MANAKSKTTAKKSTANNSSLIFCCDCGTKISRNAVICPKCGAPNLQNPGYGQKNKWVAAILAWFLGLLGIHRFYMGKNGSALAMLLLTLTVFGIFITMIWSLVDFVRLLCMTDAEFQQYVEQK